MFFLATFKNRKIVRQIKFYLFFYNKKLYRTGPLAD